MSIPRDKREWRQRLRQLRDNQSDRDTASARIAGRLEGRLQTARLACIYVSFRSEVETRPLIQACLEAGRPVCVPWCDGPERLGLSRIESLDELELRTMGLAEPVAAVRSDPGRIVPANGPDLFLVPGLGFTPRGDRLGYGRGYYDRLLVERHGDSVAAGLAFECQVIDRLPVTPTDVRVDVVITDRRDLSR